MATMRYANIDFNVVYVDPSKSSSGTGATPAQALNALPSTAASFADNTCYLIRRTAETKAAVIPNGTNSSIKNLLLLGMPNASDELYELMPSEAKSAWGGDSAEYSNIQSTAASGSFAAPNINVFLLHRVYLFRDGINADQYILKFSYSSTPGIGCFAFQHCKFGSRGINVDKSSYTGAVSASRLKSYVYIYYARMLDIRGCVINHSVSGNTQNPCGFYCYFADILNVQDVAVHSPVWTDYTSSAYPLYLAGTTQKGVECIIRNVTQTGTHPLRGRERFCCNGRGSGRDEPDLALHRLFDDVLRERLRACGQNRVGEPSERVVCEVARPRIQPLLLRELRAGGGEED